MSEAGVHELWYVYRLKVNQICGSSWKVVDMRYVLQYCRISCVCGMQLMEEEVCQQRAL